MPAKTIRVLIVDDSSLVRNILADGLNRDPGIEVVQYRGIALDDIFPEKMDVIQLRGIDKYIETVVAVFFQQVQEFSGRTSIKIPVQFQVQTFAGAVFKNFEITRHGTPPQV